MMKNPTGLFREIVILYLKLRQMQMKEINMNIARRKMYNPMSVVIRDALELVVCEIVDHT